LGKRGGRKKWYEDKKEEGSKENSVKYELKNLKALAK
jgi:hypothetical protein